VITHANVATSAIAKIANNVVVMLFVVLLVSDYFYVLAYSSHISCIALFVPYLATRTRLLYTLSVFVVSCS
jgi:hypothetical protein